ncbi:MAG: hypothetical protein U5L45_01910 [Saprospiraceae bacterium]|nr:hypothetical protein [Saprospiraceae bacterium]
MVYFSGFARKINHLSSFLRAKRAIGFFLSSYLFYPFRQNKKDIKDLMFDN